MAHEIVRFLVAHLVELFMLSVGLRTDPGTVIRAARERPWFYTRALLVLFVAVPVLTIVVTKVLALPPRMASLFVIFAACPAAPLVAPRLIKKDDRAGVTALTLVVVASFLAPALVPIWLLIANPILGSALDVTPVALLTVFLLKVLLPLTAGILARRASPRLADKAAPVFAAMGTAALLVAAVLLLKASFETLNRLTVPALIAMVLIVLGSAALGELVAGEAADDRNAVGTIAMTGSPVLALAVIHASYPGLQNVSGIVGLFLILRAVAGVPYQLIVARRRRRSAARSTAAHA